MKNRIKKYFGIFTLMLMFMVLMMPGLGTLAHTKSNGPDLNAASTGKVSDPTFSPAGGTYSKPQSVVLSCTTENAKIFYTTDGSDPVVDQYSYQSKNTIYESPILVSEDTTIKAIAVMEGMSPSDIVSATYKISEPREVDITFTNDDGYLLKTEKVNYGARPKYTGSTPTKAEDEDYTYTWTGWTDGIKNYSITDDLPAAFDNVTYRATYSSTRKIRYYVVEGEGSEYIPGADSTLTFVFKRSENDESTFDHFTGLKYDGKLLTRDKHYTATKGSVVIVLQPDFLHTVPAGSHTLTAMFDDCEEINVSFKVDDKGPTAGIMPPKEMKTKGSTALVIRWNKIDGAQGYDIFFSKCNKNKCKKVKTIKGNKRFSWTKKGLKARTPYKAYIKAWVKKNGKKKYIGTTPVYHAYTANETKLYTNAKSLTIKKKSVDLKAGESHEIDAKINKYNKKKKIMPSYHTKHLRYMTSNKKIAAVSPSGLITARSAGTCKVYVYAANGVNKAIKVQVH